jgi:3-deoxy-D-manno-octulosonic-acid transferase
MYLFYSVLLTVGFIVLLPKFVIDALRSRKYVTGLSQRLGKLPVIAAADYPIVWLHCVSVGETEAARPFVREFLDTFPSYRLVVSTTTVTGQKLARTLYGHRAALVFYFPIDWAWTVRRVLRRIKPSALFVMETELWPRLFRECHTRSIPVALLNGRISPTSFRRYKLTGSYIRRVLDDLSIAMMQSEPDATRIRELGLPAERILVSGNLKFDIAETAFDDAVTNELRMRFGLDGKRRVIVAASTHAPEERVILEAFKQIEDREPAHDVRMIIAPRHPERFDEVALLLKASGLTWSRRSEASAPSDATCKVILLDTIGELRAIYALADIAFVGGSIAPHGGHNVLEPAARGVCVVTGAHTQNFAAVTKALRDENAIVQLPEVPIVEASTRLAAVLLELLSDEERRSEISKRARLVCNQNRGATARTIETIARILSEPKAAAGLPEPLSPLHVTTAK